MDGFDPLSSFLKHEQEIKEAWQIVDLFEEERRKFEAQKAEYYARLDEMNALSSQIYEKQKELEGLENKEKILKDDLLATRRQINELESVKNAKKNNLAEEFDSMEDEVSALTQQKGKLNAEIKKEHETLKTLKHKNQALEKELHAKKKQKSRLAAELAKQAETTEKLIPSHEPQKTVKIESGPSLPFPQHIKTIQIQTTKGEKITAPPVKKLYTYQDVKKLHEALNDARKKLEEIAGGASITVSSPNGDLSELSRDNEELKARIVELELENAKMGVEIKDLSFENQSLIQGKTSG